MIKRNTKRIYYLPGMIALITLPIVGLLKINNDIRKRTEYCIPIIRLDSAAINEYSQYYSLEIPPKREYVEILMTGNQTNDSSNLPLIRNIGSTIDQRKDTTLGLKIVFSPHTKYSTYISAINELLKGKVQTYAPMEDTIFAFYIHRTDSCITSNLPDNYSCLKFFTFIDGKYDPSEEKQARLDFIKYKFKFYSYYWPIYLIIIAIIILNIQRLKALHNHKNKTLR